jgi:hypothetical protein
MSLRLDWLRAYEFTSGPEGPCGSLGSLFGAWSHRPEYDIVKVSDPVSGQKLDENHVVQEY